MVSAFTTTVTSFTKDARELGFNACSILNSKFPIIFAIKPSHHKGFIRKCRCLQEREVAWAWPTDLDAAKDACIPHRSAWVQTPALLPIPAPC